MPPKVRGPSLAIDNLPGLAFDRAIRSWIDLIGDSALTSTANGLRATKPTGTKSFCGS